MFIFLLWIAEYCKFASQMYTLKCTSNLLMKEINTNTIVSDVSATTPIGI